MNWRLQVKVGCLSLLSASLFACGQRNHKTPVTRTLKSGSQETELSRKVGNSLIEHSCPNVPDIIKMLKDSGETFTVYTADEDLGLFEKVSNKSKSNMICPGFTIYDSQSNGYRANLFLRGNRKPVMEEFSKGEVFTKSTLKDVLNVTAQGKCDSLTVGGATFKVICKGAQFVTVQGDNGEILQFNTEKNALRLTQYDTVQIEGSCPSDPPKEFTVKRVSILTWANRKQRLNIQPSFMELLAQYLPEYQRELTAALATPELPLPTGRLNANNAPEIRRRLQSQKPQGLRYTTYAQIVKSLAEGSVSAPQCLKR